ncbi:YsnF/AvaK domain-containing protein [Oxalobacteraceae bacterium OTU3CAMAD1]|nr:YsnF/AvaK domain-containing protein [Oxalobacteraceae bacterium OTU3CAMAD1]
MANESNIPPQHAAEGETVTLPVYQEQLHVDTRLADTARGVRVHKHVRSHPHQLDQTLWYDELDVRHVPVNRVVSAPPAARYEGDTFIVPVLEEVLVVEKRYRIKEELHITRLRHASRHQQTVPLRAEHVTVERFDDGNGGQPSTTLTKEATMAHTLAAVFEQRGDADRAKAELLNAGFSSSAVRLASGTGTQTQASTQTSSAASTDDSIGGSIMQFFSSIFGNDEHADKQAYSSAINRGNTVLTVDASTEDEIERAADIIEGFGPLDIDEQQGLSGQAPPQAYQGAHQGGMASAAGSMQDAQAAVPGSMQGVQSTMTGTMQGGTQATAAGAMGGMQGGTTSAEAGSMQRTTTEEQAIPVIQEELKVGKRTVQRGGVRVYQRVIETPVQEDITLREEHVTIERHPVDQAIAPDQVPAFQEKSFELRESAEEAVVQKSARVVEEVVVGKEVSQRQEQISDTVRSTDVEVEQIAPDIDTHFHTHWQSNYASSGGSYEDYDPAYRYGSSMASHESYRGRPWNDVEPELRSNWESSYPQSGWEKFKAAVREGWDRMTS